MHIQCSTESAILLAGYLSPDFPVLRFITEGKELPGLHLTIRPNVMVVDQLRQRLVEFLGAGFTATSIDLATQFAGTIDDPIVGPTTLYLASIPALAPNPPGKWATIPELLRAMKADRRRVAYLQAWQVLSSGIKDDIEAIETDKSPLV